MGYVVVYDTVPPDSRHKDGSIPLHTAIVGGIFGVGSLRGNLSGANLTGTNLTQKQLEEGAILSGANLFRALLNQKQLEAPAGDEDTKLPPDLKPPAHWSGKTDEQPKEN
jgi:hypothetical protein